MQQCLTKLCGKDVGDKLQIPGESPEEAEKF